MKQQINRFSPANLAAWMTLAVGALSCAAETIFSAPFFLVRAHAIRPMIWASDTFLLVRGSLFVAVPCFLVALWGSRRSLAVLGLGLALAVYPLAWTLLHLAMLICGFELAD